MMNIVEEIINIKKKLTSIGSIPSPLDSWPVGSIYIGITDTNPSTLLGGGTWVAFGTGRVLVGQDTFDTTFDTLGGTGGEKAHKLTSSEAAQKAVNSEDYSTALKSNSAISVNGTGRNFPSSGGNNHFLYKSAGAYSEASGVTRGITVSIPGSDAVNAHNNLQPYIVVKMWKRTA